MLNFNPKTSIWKYPIFCSWYNFFNANVSDFYTYFTIKNQTLSSHISAKNYVILILFNNKNYLFFNAL